MGVAIFFLVLAAVFALWGLISPEGMWNATQSWRFKDPEANRPSEAQHAMTRVGSGICLVAVAIMIPTLVQLDKSNQRQQEEDSYRACLAENRDTDGLVSAEDRCDNLNPDDSDYDSDEDDGYDLDDYDSDGYDSDFDY